MTEIIFHNVKNRLPENGEYVLAYVNRNTWYDVQDKFNNRYWKVVKFITGISIDQRTYLKNINNERSSIYKFGDEHGNNLVPYAWKEFGPSSFFGQEITIWASLPNITTLKRTNNDN